MMPDVFSLVLLFFYKTVWNIFTYLSWFSLQGARTALVPWIHVWEIGRRNVARWCLDGEPVAHVQHRPGWKREENRCRSYVSDSLCFSQADSLLFWNQETEIFPWRQLIVLEPRNWNLSMTYLNSKCHLCWAYLARIRTWSVGRMSPCRCSAAWWWSGLCIWICCCRSGWRWISVQQSAPRSHLDGGCICCPVRTRTGHPPRVSWRFPEMQFTYLIGQAQLVDATITEMKPHIWIRNRGDDWRILFPDSVFGFLGANFPSFNVWAIPAKAGQLNCWCLVPPSNWSPVFFFCGSPELQNFGQMCKSCHRTSFSSFWHKEINLGLTCWKRHIRIGWWQNFIWC